MTSFDVYALKVKKAFHFFDYNRDGYLTREEMIKVGDLISSLSKCCEAEAAATRKQWAKWADFMFPEGKIDEEGFVQRNIKLMRNFPKETREMNRQTHSDLFGCIDANKDGSITLAELGLYYDAFGYDNKEYVRRVFQEFDKNFDGLISKEELVHGFVVYWSNEPGYDFLYTPW